MTTRLDKVVNICWGNYDEMFIEAEISLNLICPQEVIEYIEEHACCVDTLISDEPSLEMYHDPSEKDKICHRIKNSLIRDCKLCWEEQLIDDG